MTTEALSAKDRDDILYRLGQTYEFYGKKPQGAHVQFWLTALHGYRAAEILTAFEQHVARGKFMPKPVEIIEIMDEHRSISRMRQNHKPEATGNSTPEIAQAWITYMRHAHGFEMPGREGQPSMPLDRALEIVNREAARLNEPNSILPEHRIPEFWGTAAA